jgi:hypothetical protein
VRPAFDFLHAESPIIDKRPDNKCFRNWEIASTILPAKTSKGVGGRRTTAARNMKYMTLLFVLGVLLPMIIGFFRSLFRNPSKKVTPVIEYVQKKGYRLVNPSASQIPGSSLLEMLKNPALRNLLDASSDVADIDGLDHASGGWLAFTSNLRSKEVTIFNCSTIGSINTNSRPIPYKVAKIKAQGLPRFSLGKNSIVHTVQDAVGKMVGDPKLAVDVDQRLYPDFSAHYWIRGSDAATVSAFLSPEKLRFIETAKLPGILSTNANYLVYFEDGTLRTEPDFDYFIATVDKLIAAIL